MSDEKAELARLEQEREQQQQQGQENAAGPSTSTAASPRPAAAAAVTDASDPAPAYEASPFSDPATHLAPTVSQPFNFPSDTPLPPYSPSREAAARAFTTTQPVAIPQITPDPASPFLTAYAPSLLGYGITDEAWRSFLETLSAFLTAKVSDRALAHAADAAKHLGKTHKDLGKSIFSHSKSVGKGITESAKRGNIIGAAMGVVGGAISIPIHATTGAIATTLSMPAHAIGALSKKPQTPLARAAAYALVANQKWLLARGLQAVLVETQELAELSGLDAKKFLECAHQTSDVSAATTLRALEGQIAPLEVRSTQPLELGKKTIWLVLLPEDQQRDAKSGKQNNEA